LNNKQTAMMSSS